MLGKFSYKELRSSELVLGPQSIYFFRKTPKVFLLFGVGILSVAGLFGKKIYDSSDWFGGGGAYLLATVSGFLLGWIFLGPVGAAIGICATVTFASALRKDQFVWDLYLWIIGASIALAAVGVFWLNPLLFSGFAGFPILSGAPTAVSILGLPVSLSIFQPVVAGVAVLSTTFTLFWPVKMLIDYFGNNYKTDHTKQNKRRNKKKSPEKKKREQYA